MNDQSNPLASSESGLSAERTAAIRERLTWNAQHTDHTLHEAWEDVRDLLAAFDQIAQERDEWQRLANQSGEKHVSISAKYGAALDEIESLRDCGGDGDERCGECLLCRKQMREYDLDKRRQAEAALVVLTQRQEQVKALIAEWREAGARHKKFGDWYRVGQGWGMEQCADELEKALGLLGSAGSEDAPR